MPRLILGESNDFMKILDADVSTEYIFAGTMLRQDGSIYAPVINANSENIVIDRRDTDETLRPSFGNTYSGEFAHPSGLNLIDGNASGNFAYEEVHTLVVVKGANTEEDGLYSGIMFRKESNANRFRKGEFSEILIYNRALSAEEIEQIQ